MSFENPLVLLGLLAIPLAIAGYFWWRRRAGRPSVPFSNVDVLAAAAGGRRLRSYLPLALIALALGSMTVALARPQVTRSVPREQATIMLAIDVSGSMAASDVDPYRLRAAQDAAEKFAEKVPRQYRLGLVSFSGVANLLLLPTTDRAAFNAAVETLQAEGATAIGEAIFASIDAMRQSQGGAQKLRSARILLLSDGENTTGRSVEEASAAARAAGVPVATVAFGTPDGTLPNGRPVPPNPDALRSLAESTGARSFESRSSESLNAIYSKLGSVIGTVKVKGEATSWPAGFAALFLLLAGVAAWRLGPRLP
ncbi:MAG TPA: VWA domain-containing protein [Miltoncostaeaceae bacterium]|nr:VWA domain-containing protein [Miltoncostaeaceae bacterium]